ncbi:MAG: cytidylate kinase family protein [Candidatus Bathyarchaeota archaeon]|nr:cytidylate kinase family protein [Candidatus Bathyarchaeota archaeon]
MDPGKLVITIAGPHGSGRTTQATKLAETFGLKYVSAGTLFRERAEELGITLEEMSKRASANSDFDNYLDRRSKEESRKGGVVIDATLSGFMAHTPDLRVFLTCPIAERVRRIAQREERDLEEVDRETRFREKNEIKRFKEYYDVDLEDLSVYDIVLNTGLFDAESTARILKNIVDEYLKTGETCVSI